jgi:hypothetical protein
MIGPDFRSALCPGTVVGKEIAMSPTFAALGLGKLSWEERLALVQKLGQHRGRKARRAAHRHAAIRIAPAG